MSRLPIRIRLTLPFAVVMAAVLAAMGFVLYLRVGSALLASVDQNLQAQRAEATSHAIEGHQELLDRDVSNGPAVAQVQLATGAVVRSFPDGLRPIVPRPLLDAATAGRTVRTTTGLPGLRGDWRVLAMPVHVRDGPAVLLIGRSLAAREETLDRLGREFLFAAPAALLVAILAGYGLAAAALRPVEAMRRRAASVTAHSPGTRLPVPPAQDEIHALAITLNDMLDRLEAAFEHERRFVADASHELRTPLALLRAELELALRRPRSREQYAAAIRSAAEETERLSRLAEDLLLIARIDEGRLPIRREELNGRELLDRVRERFAVRAAELDRPLLVADGADVVFEADPVRLEQALGNLVENAFVHATGDIELTASRTNGVVELHVTDHGPGLPDGFAERAFDRFSRHDDAREGGGVGLGLAIVDLIARAHGGTARVAPAPGGGADVCISIPAS
ncbi:MAG TPA: ATP-binding protein [Gaiellaceae bacterium]